MKTGDMQAAENTDRELWRESDDYYSNSVHVTERGGVGINVGGTVHVRPIAEWHKLVSETAGLRAQLEALTVLLRAKCSDREWAEMCKKFDELAKTAELRALVVELAGFVPDHQIIDWVHDPKVCLKCRAEEARKP